MNTIDLIKQHVGSRVRLTFPNGCQRAGDVTPHREPFGAFFDGRMIGGEVLPAWKIERMAASGRYQTVWEVERPACRECGQLLTTTDAVRLCRPCRDRDRAPQGETVPLFVPAPNVMPGQLDIAL